MVLLVIDTQKGITDERLHEFGKLKENILALLSEARKNRVEVVYVRHDDGPGTGFSGECPSGPHCAGKKNLV